MTAEELFYLIRPKYITAMRTVVATSSSQLFDNYMPCQTMSSDITGKEWEAIRLSLQS